MSGGETYIGCVDGKVLKVHRRGAEVVVSIDEVDARLSLEAADRLRSLLTDDSPPGTTARTKKGIVLPETTPSSIGIADLIHAEHLRAGEALVMTYRGRTHQASITAHGYLDVDGRIFETPSGAGKSITGTAINGWITWKTSAGITIDSLRWRLKATQFLGTRTDISEKYLRQKRNIAIRWVDYALQNDIYPGKRDLHAVRHFLEMRAYAPKTIEMYTSHLDEWFAVHDSQQASRD